MTVRRSVSLRRLRLSEQVLNHRARQNSDSVSEDVYRHRDSSAADIAAETIIEGQQDALDHAQATVSVRSLTAADVAEARRDPESVATKLGVSVPTLNLILAGQLDTPTCSCADFHASPFAQGPVRPVPGVVSRLPGMSQLCRHPRTPAPAGDSA